MRDNLLWNDGTPLTAHDFEYAWKRVLDPQTASENAYMMYPLNNGEAFFKQEVSADQVGVKALDDKTLYVKLKAPITYFLNLTAFHAYYPVPHHVVEKDPEIWAANDKIVSNGPFVLLIGYILINYNLSKMINIGIKIKLNLKICNGLSVNLNPLVFLW